MMEMGKGERASFNRQVGIEGDAQGETKNEEDSVDANWRQAVVKQDKIKFEQSVSTAELATQELLDDGQGTHDAGKDGENRIERGVATPHVRPPVSYPYAQEGAGGTAKAGSRVDEKSGVRYQPQPLRAGAAQQTPKMVESLCGAA